MKISGVPKVLALTFSLLLAANALASSKGILQINNSVTVNGKQLAPGQYAVKWEGNGPQVQVSILKGKSVVVTTTAHLVDLNSAPPADSAMLTKNQDGSTSLAQIRFGGKKYALSIDDSTT